VSGSADSPVAVDPPAAPAAPTVAGGWNWGHMGRVVVGLVLLGLAARLIALGARPLHHDESLDAWFSWKFLNGTYEGYDPVYHGPLRFYVTALFFAVMGESVVIARLLAALSGAVVVMLPWFWRRDLGMAGTVAAVGLLAVSPSMLYFSRMGREDAPFLALSFGAVLVFVALLRSPASWQPAALLVLIVAGLAVKESMFLLVFIFGSFGMTLVIQDLLFSKPAGMHATDGTRRLGPDGVRRIVSVLGLVGMVATLAWIGVDPGQGMSVAGRTIDATFFKLGLYGLVLAALIMFAAVDARSRGAGLNDIAVIVSLRRVGARAWAIGVGAATAAFVLVFSQFFTNFSGPGSEQAPNGGLLNGLTAGVKYWLNEQDTVRGDARWQYYLAVIPAYEAFIVVLALVGVVRVLRRPDQLGQLLLWWAVASFAIHSWAGERMPWLIIHPLLPMVLLGALGVQELWERVWRRRGQLVRVPLALLFVVGLGWTVHTSYQASYVRGGEPQELFVQAAQATPEVPEWVDRLHRFDRLVRSELGRGVSVSIDSDVYWPYGWYLRDFPAPTYAVLDADSDPPDSDIVFLPHWDRGPVGSRLVGYVELDYEHRWWWVPDLDAGAGGFDLGVTASAWANWLWDREVWDGTDEDRSDCPGSLVGTVYVRSDIFELEQRYVANNPDDFEPKPAYDGPCARDDA
jgi:predicted membrane-bound mannosyltransferase